MKKFVFIMPLMAISLLASCGNDNGERYVVYFDTNGGSPEVKRQIVKENDYARDPQIDVKRNGISMSYWSLQDEEEVDPSEFTFKDNKITSDITLHAIYPADTTNPLTITCTKGSMNLSLYWYGELKRDSEFNIKWSKNKVEWETFSTTIKGESYSGEKVDNFSVPLNAGDTIYLVGKNPNGWSFDTSDDVEQKDWRFIIISNEREDDESEFEVSGNPLSLVDEADYKRITKIPSVGCFDCLFEDSNVTSAKKLNLSCDELSKGCYCGMFEGCDKLKDAPNLPSTKLAPFCYKTMFGSCDNLENVPQILPATTLAVGCYLEMFHGCDSLTVTPELPAVSFNEDCINCYKNMFNGCESLSHIKVGFGEGNEWPGLSNNDFTEYWLSNVPESGTFEWKGSNSPSFTRDGNTVPNGWTIKPY
ncbi:MAG: hypothetical protein MJ214_04275 [Bacilli bacterium]|nr:hypothetical protein [Bacilli bacterium]